MLAPMMQTVFFPFDINADVGRAHRRCCLRAAMACVRFPACQTGEMLRYSPLGTHGQPGGDAGFFG